jgi:phosphoribulokinase
MVAILALFRMVNRYVNNLQPAFYRTALGLRRIDWSDTRSVKLRISSSHV